MKKRLVCFAVILSAVNIGDSYAQVEHARPEVGIALSGGGARGIAHLGVLRTLEELRVPVDYIAGTSMGAIIGGLYASGMSPDEIQVALENLDLDEVLSDKAPREALSFRRREDGRRYLFEIEMGITNDGVQLPSGLIAGQVLGLLLRKHTLHVAGIEDFDDLPIPFRAIATDIERGEEVVLDHGDLADAIRASMSVPVIFSPVEIDGRKLVDGGMTNNLPADLVREMGADVVVAVDASVPLLAKEKLNTLFDISEQTMVMLARTKVDDQLARADVSLVPELNGFAFSDYELVTQISSTGEDVVRSKASELSVYSLPPNEYRAYRQERRTKPVPPKRVDAVATQVPEWVDKRLIFERIRTRPGTLLVPSQLERDVANVYAIGEFERVDYTVDVASSDSRVTIRTNEKQWGPNYLHFGLRLVTDSGGADLRTGIVTFTGVANFTRTRLNARGAEWRSDVRFGQTVELFSEIYQPIDFSGRWFVASSGSLRRRQQPVFDSGRLVAEYDVDRRIVGVDAGRHFGRFGELRFGLQGGRINAKVDTGSADLPTVKTNSVVVSSRFVIDQVDNINFPHSGTFVGTELLVSLEELGSDDSYERLSLDVKGFLTKGRHTGFGTLTGGTSFDSDLPAFDDFQLGGFLSLSGFGEGELRGSHFVAARCGYYYRFARLPPASRGLYLGGWVETGKVWENTGLTKLKDSVFAGTVVVGADTGLGPLFIGYGWAEHGDDRVYLSLGSTF